MQLYALLAVLPVVLGCTNPDSDPCASFMTAQAATASAFCATFTKSTVTATAGLPAWASNCSNKPSAISKECTCAFTAGSGATTTPATTTTLYTSTTKTTTSSGAATTSASNSCGAAPVDQLVGYGAGTTGGGSGSGVTVTSCSALSAAIANGGVIKISGLLSGCGVYDVKSSTTIIGVGSGSGMTKGGLRIKGQTNVILRNLIFKTPLAAGDLVAIDTSSKIWIDHCDFSAVGLTGGKDDYDGLLDITHAGDLVTVSWCKFHDHWKASLVGHSDSNGSEDTGHLRVTYHHNYWYNVNSRLPSIRFGTAHIYSSCFESCPTSGINVRMGAKALVENNYFSSVKLAITTNLDSDEPGYATSKNNVFVNSTTDITQTGNTAPSYSYTQDPASCVCALVKSKAGTGVVG